MTTLRIDSRPRLVVDGGPRLVVGGATTINVDGDVTVVEPGAGGGAPSGGAGGILAGEYPDPGFNEEAVHDFVGAMAGRGLRYVDADDELVALVPEFDVRAKVANEAAISGFAAAAAWLGVGTRLVLWWTAAGSVVAWEYVKAAGGLVAVAELVAPRLVASADTFDASSGQATWTGPSVVTLVRAETWLGGDGTVSWFDPTEGAVSSVNGHTGAVTLAASDVGAQPSDSDLTAIAALTTTTFGRSLLELADAAALLSAAGAQPSDSDLTSIAALSTTSFGRSLLTVADAAALLSAAGAQAADADLTAIAALTTTSFGRALLALADAAALRTSADTGNRARKLLKLSGYSYTNTYDGVPAHGGLWNGQAVTLAAHQMTIAPAAVWGTVERLAMYVTSATAGSSDTLYIVCYSADANGGPDALLWSESTTIGALTVPGNWVKSSLSRSIPDGAWLGVKNGSTTGNVVGRALAWAPGAAVMVSPTSPGAGSAGMRTVSYSGAPPANVTSAATWTNVENSLPLIVARSA